VEKFVTADKKEADQYDKMLDVADNLSEYIEGKGIFIINDLMHSRKTNQIDIFRFSTTKAEDFGVQHARAVLLD
jgi:dsDNA-binding SOS-regulon protein